MSRPRLRQFTAQQALVLRAALGDPAEAHLAWDRLLGGSDEVPVLDQGSFRLLPLVYRHLGATGRPFAAEAVLRGIYRQAWYRNQIAAATTGQALAVLDAAGIGAMLLKGWAVVELGYREPGRRPMNDTDLLVHPRHFDRACDVLGALGFLPVSGIGRTHRGRRTFHAVALQNGNGVDIDLHHHMLEEGNWPGADLGVWERSSPVEFGGHPVRVPAVEDLLLNVCAHGVRWDPVPGIRWLADAVTLVRAHPVDWQLVVAEASRRGASLAIEAALWDVNEFERVPPGALEQLARANRRRIERLDFSAQQGSDTAQALAWRYITRFLRLTSGRNPVERGMAFPVFLQGMWELDSVRSVPPEGVRRLWARLRGRTPHRRTRRGN